MNNKFVFDDIILNCDIIPRSSKCQQTTLNKIQGCDNFIVLSHKHIITQPVMYCITHTVCNDINNSLVFRPLDLFYVIASVFAS